MDPKTIPDLTSRCIRCGFCLESCPTFVISGKENESPRGRIYLIRQAQEGNLDWVNDVEEHLDTCLGCRACETACPSGVEYGSLLELARQEVKDRHPQRARNLLLTVLTNPKLFGLQLKLTKFLPGRRMPSIIARLFSGEPPEVAKPKRHAGISFPTLDESSLPPVRGEVVLLEGCVMRELFPGVHVATRRLLRRLGYRTLPLDLGCCGALHAHQGDLPQGIRMASKVFDKLPPETPLIVNSAGCGSFLKDQGSHRPVYDLSEFLNKAEFKEMLAALNPRKVSVTYHEACHLINGQKISHEPRELLGAIPGIEFVELGEADLCCGSAGVYNLFQPTRARKLLDRKWSNIEKTSAQYVVMSNPGCQSWIEQARAESNSTQQIVHLAEFLEAILSDLI